MTNLPIKLGHAAVGFVVLFFAMNALTARAQYSDAVVELAARVNRERVTRGLAPLALNAQLTTAAQAHAEDVARTGRTHSPQAGHLGSDGSTATERIARAGYGKYSWGYRAGENWAHYRSAEAAMMMWMDSTPHRNNLLHQLYREMGIGIAPTSNGTFVYVIDFGVQPNVLPIFINDGASETKSLDVKITLTSEEVVPNGDGDNIGRPTEVMLSNAADFAGAKWQPYARTIHWTLAPNGGTKTVYVKYRDAKGRTATASDSIGFAAATTQTITPTRVTPTRTATRVTSRPTTIATLVPTETPTAAPTEIVPTATPSAIATVTAVTTETVTPTPTRGSAASSGETGAAPNFDGLGLFGIAVMSIVLIRVWYTANH